MTAAVSDIGAPSVHPTRWWHAILLMSALVLPLATLAQDVSQIKDALRLKKPPLKVELRALTPTACIGAPLKLRIEVTNVGQETLRVNRAYFWNNSSEYPTSPEGEKEDKSRFLSIAWPFSRSEDIFLLAPGETYIAHTYWWLDEETTKSKPDNYTLELKTYGTLNKVQFDLRECNQKELRSKNEYQR